MGTPYLKDHVGRTCPFCGGTLRVIADVTDPDVIRTILAYLKQRAPPVKKLYRCSGNFGPLGLE